MSYRIDPIIKCNITEGTTFLGPLKGEMVEWRIDKVDVKYVYVSTHAHGRYSDNKYTFNQFGYLMTVKKIFHFIEVKL